MCFIETEINTITIFTSNYKILQKTVQSRLKPHEK